MFDSDELTVGSINVRGIRDSVKRKAVFSFLGNYRCTVFFYKKLI